MDKKRLEAANSANSGRHADEEAGMDTTGREVELMSNLDKLLYAVPLPYNMDTDLVDNDAEDGIRDQIFLKRCI